MQETISAWTDMALPWFLAHGIKILIILIVAIVLGKILVRLIKRAVRISVAADKTRTEVSAKKREQTLTRIFSGATRIIIWLMAFLMILQELGVMIGPILAGAGIAGLALGFGGQYLIRDIIAGLFIILENQYRIGDVVGCNETRGLVEDITLRKTTLRDLDGVVHHIPHGEIKLTSNFSKTFSRVNLEIGIAYNSDLEKVIETVNRTGTELAEDPAWKELIISPPQFLRINDFADSAIVIKILGETQPIRQWEVTGELRKRLKIAFDREGIEIPFPQRVIHQAAPKK